MKRSIKKWASSAIWVLLFSSLVVMMTGHFIHIAHSVDPLDDEMALIQDVSKTIPRGDKVSFATDLSDDEASQGAYYRTQFCWCPMILTDTVAASDEIIFYYSPAAGDSSLSFLHHCDTAWQRSAGPYTLLLLKPNHK